jgi:alpha-ribazole phosphatase
VSAPYFSGWRFREEPLLKLATANSQTLWVRHGPTDAAGLCYGRSDVSTKESAENNSQTLVAATPKPCTLWSSPLARCVHLAQSLGEAWRLPLTVDARLQEMDYGDFEGRLWADIERNDALRLNHWMEHWKTEGPPNGESLLQLEVRVAAVARVIPEGALVVTHAGVIRTLMVLRGQRWEEAMKHSVPHLLPIAL